MEVTIHRAGVSWTGGEGEDVQAHDVLLGTQTLPSSSALELGGDEVKSNPGDAADRRARQLSHALVSLAGA